MALATCFNYPITFIDDKSSSSISTITLAKRQKAFFFVSCWGAICETEMRQMLSSSSWRDENPLYIWKSPKTGEQECNSYLPEVGKSFILHKQQNPFLSQRRVGIWSLNKDCFHLR